MRRPVLGHALPRRLRHRLPVRLRHHWNVLAACGVFFAVLVGLVGTSRVAPFVISDERAEADVVTEDIAGTVDIFDSGVAHQLTLSYTDDDYQRMLDDYFKDGEKEYVEADLVVDGTSVPSVGIRLKGNSTLRSLTRNGEQASNTFGGERGNAPGNAPGGDRGNAPGGAPDGAAPDGAAPGGVEFGDGAVGDGAFEDGGGFGDGAFGGGRGGPGMTTLKAEEPESLPWLISFDEYVKGRRYQGHTEIAVRPAGTAGATGLNEAVALSLVAQAGEPSQDSAYTSFTVNDRPTVTRLLVQHPDVGYADDLAGDGVLYKALVSSQFTDQGDDPTDYQDDFKQVNLKGSQDLQPVIDLIRWVGDASDQEFAAGLAERLEVESFARYLALQNLLLNFDDMSGPGRNYYLYYNLDTKRFTVLTWDLNLALSGDATQGPNDTGRMGGFPGGGGQAPDGQRPQGDQPPEGGQLPDGGQLPGGGMQQGHVLKERFLASDTFTAVYEDAYRDLYQKLYASGTARATVEQISAAAKAAGADASTVDTEASSLLTLVDNRTKSLASDEVITQ